MGAAGMSNWLPPFTCIVWRDEFTITEPEGDDDE